jgi:hypothetical protein
MQTELDKIIQKQEEIIALMREIEASEKVDDIEACTELGNLLLGLIKELRKLCNDIQDETQYARFREQYKETKTKG